MPLAELGSLLAVAADALAWPLLLLQAQGLLVYANRAGRDALASGWPLLLDDEHRVRPLAASQRAGFAAALHTALTEAAASWSFEAVASGRAADATVALRRLAPQPGAEPLLLLALPRDRAAPLRAYATGLSLTPAQTRVLLLLAQGHDAHHMAADLGVALSAVRTHLAQLRRKSGHRSTAALLLALARLPPAWRPGRDGQ